MALGARIAEALKDKGKNQAWLARESGVDEATISALITRDSRRSEHAPAIAEALAVSLRWLTTSEGNRDAHSVETAEVDQLRFARSGFTGVSEPTPRESRYVMVRRLNASVSAGPGAQNEDDETRDHIAFRRDWLQRKGWTAAHLVAVEVDGDSMSPTFEDGDALLVNVSDREVKDGRIYAFRAHGEVRLKRFQRTAAGGIRIISDNKSPRFPDEELTPEQLHSLDVIGRVVWGGGER